MTNLAPVKFSEDVTFDFNWKKIMTLMLFGGLAIML